MRSASEILGEYAPDEWTGREWQAAHDAIVQGQIEALEEALSEARSTCGCCAEMLDAIEALIPERDSKTKIVDTLKHKESS